MCLDNFLIVHVLFVLNSNIFSYRLLCLFFFLLLIYFYFFYKLKNIWLFLFFLFLYFNCTLHFCFMISLKTTLFHDAGVSESLTVEVSASVLLAWLFPYPRIHEHKFQGNSRGAEAPEVRKTTRLAIFFPSILKVMLWFRCQNPWLLEARFSYPGVKPHRRSSCRPWAGRRSVCPLRTDRAAPRPICLPSPVWVSQEAGAVLPGLPLRPSPQPHWLY